MPHAPDMIHEIHFKSLDEHTKDSFTFTFRYESHDFKVKVLSNKLIPGYIERTEAKCMLD